MMKQIKGDSPEMVEYIGMKNLINAVKESVGLRNGKLVFGFEGILFYKQFLLNSFNESHDVAKVYILS